MNKTDADRLAYTATTAQLRQMFQSAQEKIRDWRQASAINPGLSLGAAFNILKCGLEKDAKEVAFLIKRNMIWEFGDFFPGYQKPRRSKKSPITVQHQEPEFIDF